MDSTNQGTDVEKRKSQGLKPQPAWTCGYNEVCGCERGPKLNVSNFVFLPPSQANCFNYLSLSPFTCEMVTAVPHCMVASINLGPCMGVCCFGPWASGRDCWPGLGLNGWTSEAEVTDSSR